MPDDLLDTLEAWGQERWRLERSRDRMLAKIVSLITEGRGNGHAVEEMCDAAGISKRTYYKRRGGD